MKTFQHLTVVTLASAGLLVAAPAAFAQDGEVNASASGEVSASGEANASVSTSAPAAGEPGKLGVGGAVSLAGLAGLEVTYHLSDKLMLNAIVGFATFSPGGNADSSNTIGIAGSAFYNLYTHAWADLYAGGRLGFSSRKANNGADVSDFLVELPLRIELHLHRRLALHFETGLVFDFNSVDPGAGAPSVSSTIIGLGSLAGSTFATGGFTINF